MAERYSSEYIEVCCKYADELLKNGYPVIFDEKHFNKIFKMQHIDLDSYQEFEIIGKNGKVRTICAPSRRLKLRQRWILDNILYKIDVSNNCEGFTKEHSAYTNAKKHIGHDQILNIDIKDFFPSIEYKKVKKVFVSIGYSIEVANKLADICCFNGVLPQGAPTSPYIANIVCIEMDKGLNDLCKKSNLVYTRYADDMTFSGDSDVETIYDKIVKIINGSGFELNLRKTRIYIGKKRKVVTGIVVKENGLSVPRQYKRKLKQEIYYCKKFGVANHLENIKLEKKMNFREYLYGKAYYIKMIEPQTGIKFLKELNEINWN